MALIAKAAGHKSMRLNKLLHDPDAHSDAWVAIKLVGLNPWPSDPPKGIEDEKRLAEYRKSMNQNIPALLNTSGKKLKL